MARPPREALLTSMQKARAVPGPSQQPAAGLPMGAGLNQQPVSPWVQEPSTWTILDALPGVSPGVEWELEQSGCEPVSMWLASCTVSLATVFQN